VKRTIAVGGLASALVLGIAGVAAAVSDGNYDYRKQHCSGAAQNATAPDRVEEGCRNISIVLADDDGHEFVSAGTLQTADGEFVHDGDQSIDPAGNAQGGLHFYFGADDNLDAGEHDSSPQINNGPSDGGAIQANLTPDSAATWVAALLRGDSEYVLTHPFPLIDAGAGMCADGVCAAVTTQRRVAYQGGRTKRHRDVADYDGKRWDPESCAGPSDTAADCGGHQLKWWGDREGTVYVEPGAQVYEDPDAQASPAGPYPLPAAYAGTCGVIAGGGPAASAPAGTPGTNSAGQVEVRTGCG
jgi:hypothetical protein